MARIAEFTRMELQTTTSRMFQNSADVSLTWSLADLADPAMNSEVSIPTKHFFCFPTHPIPKPFAPPPNFTLHLALEWHK